MRKIADYPLFYCRSKKCRESPHSDWLKFDPAHSLLEKRKTDESPIKAIRQFAQSLLSSTITKALLQHGLLSTNNQTFQARWVQGVVQAIDVSLHFCLCAACQEEIEPGVGMWDLSRAYFYYLAGQADRCV